MVAVLVIILGTRKVFITKFHKGRGSPKRQNYMCNLEHFINHAANVQHIRTVTDEHIQQTN